MDAIALPNKWEVDTLCGRDIYWTLITGVSLPATDTDSLPQKRYLKMDKSTLKKKKN